MINPVTADLHTKHTARHRLRPAHEGMRFPKGLLYPFVCLLLVELIAFGINARQVGVYQDEWICFGMLHFLPHSFGNLFSALVFDPRFIVRPLTAFQFASLFYFVWEKPFWYHVLCYTSEFFGGWFLYLAVLRLSRDRTLALAASVLFLLYPTHDASHYYISASVESVSATFFTLSLWLFLKAMDGSSYRFILWSAAAYFVSIYNYEQTLPLLALYPLVMMLHGKAHAPLPGALRQFARYNLPFLLVAASMVVFRTKLLPLTGMSWEYHTSLSPSNFMAVMLAGIKVSLSPYLAAFCLAMAQEAVKDGLSYFRWISLGAGTACVFFCLLQQQGASGQHGSKNVAVVLTGAAALLLSYTIFGISAEHMPVLDAWLNRVNICGSLGACLIVAGLLALLRDCCPAMKRPWRSIIFALSCSLLAGLFILVDWQFAKPYVISWYTQRQLMAVVRQHAGELHSGDSIILGGITCYVRWAPVADGVWDFQSLVRTTLNNRQINANVVTPRLVMCGDALEDRSGTLLLGRYPFKHMVLFAPDKGKWLRVSCRQEFVEHARELGWTVAAAGQNRAVR